MFFGIDLTSGETKPSACVCLNDDLDILYSDLLDDDADIFNAVAMYHPQLIAIDSPLSFPAGMCCLDENCSCRAISPLKGRCCERELARIGIGCFFTTKKSIIREMAVRGINLKRKLMNDGYEVIEVYPYARKVRIFGKLKPKRSPEGILQLRQELGDLLHSDIPVVRRWSHDLCDAAMAAHTGYLYIKRNTEALGDAGEGLIHIPNSSCGRREAG